MKIHSEIIPIAILHRNEGENLLQMLDSINNNTLHNHTIFIVDNNSSDAKTLQILSKIEKDKRYTVIKSKKNNWVLGFNLALKHSSWPQNAKYFVFSDSDIIVPHVLEGEKCWLSHLVDEMNAHECIGKLGISLRIDDIDNPIFLEHARNEYAKLKNNPKIGANIIAPVDTTIAIYRNNFFIGKNFAFNVGHASLSRPYYYTCRTASTLQARHLGWYKNTCLKIDSYALREKIKCFAIYGGKIDTPVLRHASLRYVAFYKIVRPIALTYWGLKVAVNIFIYLLKRFPRNINEIQSRLR